MYRFRSPDAGKTSEKFSNALNGLDLSQVRVGDVINVSPYHAAMLVLEGWAEQISQEPLNLQVVDAGGETQNAD